MKKLILSVLLFLVSSPVFADTPVFVHLTSATSQGVNVTSGTAVRVDNYNGQGEGKMDHRTEFFLQNSDSADSLFCAFDVNVSSIVGNADYGREIKFGKSVNIAMDYRMQYHCIAADAAGNAGIDIHAEQATNSEAIHEN